jgi:hypothetical protein
MILEVGGDLSPVLITVEKHQMSTLYYSPLVGPDRDTMYHQKPPFATCNCVCGDLL